MAADLAQAVLVAVTSLGALILVALAIAALRAASRTDDDDDAAFKAHIAEKEARKRGGSAS